METGMIWTMTLGKKTKTHTHMLKFIKELLFGRRASPVCDRPKAGFKTMQAGSYTNFGDWCKEFKVSMLHDRKSIHLD